MKRLSAIAALTCSLTALACGGSSDSGSDVSLGLSSEKVLSDVTQEEATRGCSQVKVAVEQRFNPATLKPKLCTLAAVQFTATESSCNTLRDSCVRDSAATAESDAEFSPGDDISCTGASVENWQGCSATVGQMETCLNDTLDAIDALLNAYTCKDAGTLQSSESPGCEPPPLDPATGQIAINPETGEAYPECEGDSVEGAFAAPELPSSCQALQTQCPNLGLFED